MVEMREIKIIPLLPPNVLRVYKRKPKMKKKKKLRQIFCVLATFTFEVMVRQIVAFLAKKATNPLITLVIEVMIILHIDI